MKKYILKKRSYLVNTIATVLVLLLVGVVFITSSKETYAIDTGVFKNGFPTGTFKPNATTTNNLNYLSTALGTNATYQNYYKNFNVQSNYADNETTPKPLYQLMKNLETPKSTESFEITDNSPIEMSFSNTANYGITYIINHGYNTINTTNTVFTGNSHGTVSNNAIKQYITQVALWLYIYENKSAFTSTYCAPTGNGYDGCDFLDTSNARVSNSTIRSMITAASNVNGYSYLGYILDLVNSAEGYDGPQTSSIANFSSRYNYTISNDGTKATISNLSPNITGNSANYMYYAVEISDPNSYGAYIADSNGNRLTNTTKMTGSFSIVIPLASNINSMDLRTITIKVYAYFTYDYNKTYIVTSSTSEPLPGLDNNLVVRYGTEKYNRYSSVMLGLTPYEVIKTEFSPNNFTRISKVNITNSQELPGAVLEITDTNNDSNKWQWTSTSKPHYISLPNGSYKLCETTAPAGFERKTECINFSVDGTKITTVVMENSPVHVPDTRKMLNKIIIIIGILSVIGGIGILIYFTKFKKKEITTQ